MIENRIDVLDKGWIELVDTMPTPDTETSLDMAVVNAARVSFLGDSKGKKKDKKLLLYLMRHRHTSPFEMVEFKFRIHAPLIVWWQWVRHRTWSFNAQSGRYTPFEENCFYYPKEWRLQSENNKQGSDGVLGAIDSDVLNLWLKKTYDNAYWFYKTALEQGIAKEQARLFLPGFSVYYTWYAKVDAHNLMNFLRLRNADDAQYEIREYAVAIERIFKMLMPWTYEGYEKYVIDIH